VRAAQIAVYQLMNIARPVPAITRHDRSIPVLIDTLEKAFA
jgi:oleate hydratase